MRGIRFAVAGLLVAGMVALVQAQPGFGGFGGGGSVTQLVSNKAVQEDIKASEEQVKKIAEWSKEFRKTSDKIREEKGVDLKGSFKGGKIDPEILEKMNAATAEINKVAYKELGDVLKKEQIDRVKQIQRQQLGLNAFTNAEVVEGLKLTDSQKTSIKGMSGDYTKERTEMMTEAFGGGKKGGFDQEKLKEFTTKSQKLQKEYIGKAVDLLDDTQKKTWKDMIGASFDLSKLQQGFGGFGKKDVKKD